MARVTVGLPLTGTVIMVLGPEVIMRELDVSLGIQESQHVSVTFLSSSTVVLTFALFG